MVNANRGARGPSLGDNAHVGVVTSIELGFLLAAPRLGDENFGGSVVLLGVHDDEGGSIGWTVNGGELEVASKIVRATGLVAPSATLPPTFDRMATVGGPVSPDSVWILHRRDEAHPLPGTIAIGEAIGVTPSPEALAVLVDGRGPTEFRLLLGHAGWGPGQLTSELAQGAWLPAKADPTVLFDEPISTMWQRAYEKAIGSIPAAFVMPKRAPGTMN
jgi:putative transcriptional regulator